MHEIYCHTKPNLIVYEFQWTRKTIDITKYQAELDHRKIIITHTSGHSGTYKTEMCMW